MIDPALAIRQKCRDCRHFDEPNVPGPNPEMGLCTLLDAGRHQRFWCDQWASNKK